MKKMTEAEKLGLKLADEIANKIFEINNGNNQAVGEALVACYVALTIKLREGFDNKLITNICADTLKEIDSLGTH